MIVVECVAHWVDAVLSLNGDTWWTVWELVEGNMLPALNS